MTPSRWFSTKLRTYCLVEGDGCIDCWEPVHVFVATTEEEAFNRALELGHTHDKEYVNAEGEIVKWRFAEIVTLDLLGEQIEDGREVYNEVLDTVDPKITFETEFNPEGSQPIRTGV